MYVTGVRAGIKPTEFWDMTLGEIVDTVDQYIYLKQKEIEIHKNESDVLIAYVVNALHQLPINMGVVLGGKSRDYPDIKKFMPDSIVKQIENKKKSGDEISAKFMLWAKKVNARKLAELNREITGSGK